MTKCFTVVPISLQYKPLAFWFRIERVGAEREVQGRNWLQWMSESGNSLLFLSYTTSSVLYTQSLSNMGAFRLVSQSSICLTVIVCAFTIKKSLMKEENCVCVWVCVPVLVHVCYCQNTLGYLSVFICLHVTSSTTVWTVMSPERCLPPSWDLRWKPVFSGWDFMF